MTTRVQDPAINLHQMRVEFFSFERGVIEAHLENVLESIKRSHPNFNVPTFRMLSFHNLLEFQTTQPCPGVWVFQPLDQFGSAKSASPRIVFCVSFHPSSKIFPGVLTTAVPLPAHRGLEYHFKSVHSKWEIGNSTPHPNTPNKFGSLEKFQPEYIDG